MQNPSQTNDRDSQRLRALTLRSIGGRKLTPAEHVELNELRKRAALDINPS